VIRPDAATMTTSAFALPAQLTMAVAAAAHAQTQAALARAPGAQPFTVDAGALREFDTSVLAVLLDASRTCQTRGSRLAIANAPAKLSQLAALYGVDALLGLSPA
jgi:phospholipid transport system transporter-binding protein